MLVIDEEGVDSLISELHKGVADNQVLLQQLYQVILVLSLFFPMLLINKYSPQALMRRGSSYLIGYFFKNSKLYLVDEASNMIYTLVTMLSDSDSATVAVNL